MADVRGARRAFLLRSGGKGVRGQKAKEGPKPEAHSRPLSTPHNQLL